MLISRLCVVALGVLPLPLLAHEFWIEPQKYQVETGETSLANLRNGQNFDGITLAYFDTRTTRHEVIIGDAVVPLVARAGDTPAMTAQAPDHDALLVFAHETTPSTLTYKTWEKFQVFIDHKDFEGVAETHRENRWPLDNFRESYTRHAKALVAVGTGQGADRALGMKTEFVALSNPYDAIFDHNMRINLLFEGAPRAHAQVEVFERAPDQSVTVMMHHTDAAGTADIAVQPGHSYLFDAVVLRPADAPDLENRPVLWHTYWAALSFYVP